MTLLGQLRKSEHGLYTVYYVIMDQVPEIM